MAKVKSAKQRITEYLKSKGLDSDEIKETFADLDTADADLERLAAEVSDIKGKNAQWQEWYAGVAPEIQAVLAERDQYKELFAKMKDAGVDISGLSAAAKKTEDKLESGDYITPAQFKQYQEELGQKTSMLMKQLTRVSMRHLKDFNEELDLDEVEKLVMEKGYSVDDAYGFYVAPKQKEREKKEMEATIEKRVQEQVRDTLSKQGIRQTRKRTDDIEPADLDKPAPSDKDLLDAFVNDLSESN